MVEMQERDGGEGRVGEAEERRNNAGEQQQG